MQGLSKISNWYNINYEFEIEIVTKTQITAKLLEKHKSLVGEKWLNIWYKLP